MKKKFLVTVLAAVTACSLLTLNGCSFNLDSLKSAATGTSADTEDTLSAEPEGEIDGDITFHTRWYDYDDTKLAMANVTVSSNGSIVYGGTTDENGRMDTFTVPANTELNISVTNSSGQIVGEANIICHLSYDYSKYTIYPVHTEVASSEDGSADAETTNTDASDTPIEIEVPADSADVSAAIFMTSGGSISFANMCPYTETESIAEDSDTAEDISGDVVESEASTPDPISAHANQGDVNVRSTPVDGEMVGYLTDQQAVTITNTTTASDGSTWYEISFTQDGGDFTGWVRSDFITEDSAEAAAEEAPAEDTATEEAAPAEETAAEETPAE